MTLKHARIALMTMALVTVPAVAEARSPIVTDRPDIAESSLTVGHGIYQLEQAAQNELSGGVSALMFPSLHRVGLGDRFELRMETPLVNMSAGRPGFDELAVGGKYHLLDGGEFGEWPSLAVLAHATLTNGGGFEPITKLLVDTALPFDLGVGFNVGASLPPGNAAPAVNFAGSISRNLTDPLRIYGELSGDQDFGAGQSTLGVDGGLVYLVNDDFQLDLAAYKGLTATSVDWYVTSGVSVRWGGR
jgi:hypothetical protein